MEPRIQYAKTSDGVNIAYFEYGSGPPNIFLNDIPFSHTQLEHKFGMDWSVGADETGTRGIRLDPRGMGMSDRDVERFTLDKWVLDVEAVVNKLGLETFMLSANGFAGVIAMSYAARHPEQVTHLVLINATARPAEAFATPVTQSLANLLATDWEMFSENVGALAFGWGVEAARAYGEYVRACTTRDVARATYATLARIDLTDSLDKLMMPTLVLHHMGIRYLPLELGRKLVAALPNAQLSVIEGTYSEVSETLSVPIRQFLDAQSEPIAQTPQQDESAFRTILFTDVESSTALTERLGDDAAREVFREHERITRELLKSHGGSEVKTMGDGFMASFSSATRALECAIAMQRAFDERSASADEPVRIRIGMNAGEPIAEDDDLFGTSVILAARIASKAQGGEILVSEAIRQIVAGKRFLMNDRGETEMRGFEDPVRIYELNWRQGE